LGFEGDKLKETVTITSLEKLPFNITEITSNIEDKIEYKLKTKKKGKAYTLEVRNRSSQKGSFHGSIELKTDSKHKPRLNLPVTGVLREKVTVRPGSLSFGTIDTTREGSNTQQLKRKVVLKDNQGKGFAIKKIKTSEKWIMTETKTEVEGKQYSIVITLDEDKLPKGPFEEKINIRTSYKRKPLVVNVKGNVL